MAVLSTIVGVLLTATFASAGIYPDNHWEHSTHLTLDNVDAWVQEKVDAGKTAFIRWIVSEVQPAAVKQAPAWNEVTAKFKSNPDVAFGDVLLADSLVHHIHGVDQGVGNNGWPNIRIFNKETGYGGKAFERKTSEPACDELGPETKYMQQLVEEYATICNIEDTSVDCTDKEKDFIAKWAEKPLDEIKKQLSRLTKMADGPMKPDAKHWVKQRVNVFKQLLQPDAKHWRSSEEL
jgi:hypothetical protein